MSLQFSLYNHHGTRTELGTEGDANSAIFRRCASEQPGQTLGKQNEPTIPPWVKNMGYIYGYLKTIGMITINKYQESESSIEGHIFQHLVLEKRNNKQK